jgi:hypothetical protein
MATRLGAEHGDNGVANQNGIGLAFESQDGLMFAQCVARGTPTYVAAADVVFELVAEI